ncbi:MAG: signal peptidase I [Verrucomicrobiota bacterium]
MLQSFLNNPRKDVKEFLLFLSKKISYQKDLLSDEKLEQALELREQAEALYRDKSKSKDEVTKDFNKIQQKSARIFKVDSNENWREWVEVILVASVVAIAFKTYFFQPFKIPTHSMKPTLYGIYTESLPSDQALANPAKRILQLVLQGKSHHRIEIKKDGVLRSIEEKPFFKPLPIRVVDVHVGNKKYRVWSNYKTFLEGTGGQLRVGDHYKKGQVVANYTNQAGDHLFVNKFIYHFRRPKQGEVFVFTTNGIRDIEDENRSKRIHWGQFYIKRCVGVPGNRLRLEQPYLFSNGAKLENREAFERIYSLKNGYHGYVYGGNYLRDSKDVTTLSENDYWAMGDNSGQSWDSRGWGAVPERNLVGTGSFVYWPFTDRWGLID